MKLVNGVWLWISFFSSLYEIPSVSVSSFGMDFGKLLDETDEMDSIHDVTFQIGTRMYPVHKYILAVRSDFFKKLFVSSDNQLDTPDITEKMKMLLDVIFM